jgi:TATA-binding protein-associated factor Taf7
MEIRSKGHRLPITDDARKKVTVAAMTQAIDAVKSSFGEQISKFTETVVENLKTVHDNHIKLEVELRCMKANLLGVHLILADMATGSMQRLEDGGLNWPLYMDKAVELLPELEAREGTQESETEPQEPEQPQEEEKGKEEEEEEEEEELPPGAAIFGG